MPSRGVRWPLVAVIVVALVAAGIAAAFLSGVFTSRAAALPNKVGSYSLDSASRRSTNEFHDSATYRAAPGDVYVANLLRDGGADTAVNAVGATVFRLDDITCTKANAQGMGGVCRVTLPSGVVLVVESSPRHSASEIARFTAQVAAGVS